MNVIKKRTRKLEIITIMEDSVKNKFFTREICVCAHLTQTRYAQKTCAEMRIFINEFEKIWIYP